MLLMHFALKSAVLLLLLHHYCLIDHHLSHGLLTVLLNRMRSHLVYLIIYIAVQVAILFSDRFGGDKALI